MMENQEENKSEKDIVQELTNAAYRVSKRLNREQISDSDLNALSEIARIIKLLL